MTLGGMVGEKESLRQLDRAFDGGINFFDTAEQYASPPTAKSYGRSEKIIGKWLATKPRDAVVVATKITGPSVAGGHAMPHIRHGQTAFDLHHLTAAVEGSLKRLGTDTIDLFQTHWPDREIPFTDQLEAMERLIEAGKVRYYGVSHETPWGLTRLAALAESHGLPRVVSAQNLYNLLERQFEGGMAEVCERENIGGMAFSVLAMGVLTGKYSGGALPKGSRLEQHGVYRDWGYTAPRMLAAADRYADVAKSVGLAPASLAIAWILSRPFVTAALSSCTRMEQLDALLTVPDAALDEDTLARIGAIHAETGSFG